MARHQTFIHSDFHVIKLDLHAVEQCVFVGRPRRHFVQGVNHVDDAVHDAFGQHKTEIPGTGLKGRPHKGFGYASDGASAPPDQISEALHHHAAAEHITEPRDALAITVGIFERLGEMLGDQQGEIGVLGLFGRVLIAVPVDGDDAAGIFRDDDASRIHAKGSHLVSVFLGTVDNFAFVKLIGQMRKNLRRQLDAHADVHAV